MADFAPTATPRYTAEYVSAGVTHTVTFRGARGIDTAAMTVLGIAACEALAEALQSLLPTDFAWTNAKVGLEDSDLMFPATTPGATSGDVDLADLSDQDRISRLTFPARGTLGSKFRVSMYGLSFSPDDTTPNPASNFIVTRGESGVVAGAFDDLAAISGLRAIDNSSLIWGNRATLKVDDHWLKLLRRGGI